MDGKNADRIISPQEIEEYLRTFVQDERHSVEFHVNAKGELSTTIKCYGATPEEAYERASRLNAMALRFRRQMNGTSHD